MEQPGILNWKLEVRLRKSRCPEMLKMCLPPIIPAHLLLLLYYYDYFYYDYFYYYYIQPNCYFFVPAKEHQWPWGLLREEGAGQRRDGPACPWIRLNAVFVVLTIRHFKCLPLDLLRGEIASTVIYSNRTLRAYQLQTNRHWSLCDSSHVLVRLPSLLMLMCTNSPVQEDPAL